MLRRFRRWLAPPDRVLEEVQRNLEVLAVDCKGEKVVQWDEKRTRALLRLPGESEG